MDEQWDGRIPERRYAMVAGAAGERLTVISGGDMAAAPGWPGFVKWVGAVRPAETRDLRKYTKGNKT